MSTTQPQPELELSAVPRPCEFNIAEFDAEVEEPCNELTIWTWGAEPMCLQHLQTMANMNSDNATAVAAAIPQTNEKGNKTVNTTITKIEWRNVEVESVGYLGEDTENIVPYTYQVREAIGTGLGYIAHESDEYNVLSSYTITHVASGYKIISDPMITEELAKHMVIALAPLMSWNMSKDELHAKFSRTLASTIREICQQVGSDYWQALNKCYQNVHMY